MDCEAKYDPETGTILVRVLGQLHLTETCELASKVAALAARHSAKRMLADMRGATPRISPFDVYDLPTLLSELGYKKIKRALLVNADIISTAFRETIEANQTETLRLFTDEAEARRWLAAECPLGPSTP